MALPRTTSRSYIRTLEGIHNALRTNARENTPQTRVAGLHQQEARNALVEPPLRDYEGEDTAKSSGEAAK